MHVLPYDTDAQGPFAHLRRRRVRIGTQDWRSAAIALRWRATVVTRNSRDVVQVPGLNIVDWSIA
jgi:tRNA(fMet)-specific endonuclease VapC